MTLAHKLGLSVFALLCSAQFALAQEAAKPQAPAPAPAHWYDTVAGTKFTSVEGATAQITVGEEATKSGPSAAVMVPILERLVVM